MAAHSQRRMFKVTDPMDEKSYLKEPPKQLRNNKVQGGRID